MISADIAAYRLAHQRLAHSEPHDPAEIVASLGALQAQDYQAALWAIGLRMQADFQSDVERAISERKIVRTWPMRGTLHFVAAQDVRWMLQLLTPRVIAGSAGRQRALGLDNAIFARSAELFGEALHGGKALTRDAMYHVLEQGGISTAGQRGYHLLWRSAQEGLICFGPHDAKQPTFVLLDEWLPKSRTLEREEALAVLAARYFGSHGPATLQDFAWWSGLTMVDARLGLQAASPHLVQEKVGEKAYWMASALPELSASVLSAYLLPGFDEYLLGYTDRSAVLATRHASRIVPGSNGVFMPTLILGGQVRGTWKRTLKMQTLFVTLFPFEPLTSDETLAARAAAEHYCRFLGVAETCILQVEYEANREHS